MRIMIIDDDEAVRLMLQDIIEDYDLGEVVASWESAHDLDNRILSVEQVDILIIDMLMPGLDGIKAAAGIRKDFAGKIIMLSQVESKDLVGRAYEHGIDYYITKPLNRKEILSVIRNVSSQIRLENFAHDLQDSLVEALPKPVARQDAVRYSIRQRGEQLLKGLGIVNNAGAEDLLDILNWLGSNKEGMQHQPSLRKIFTSVAAGEKETDNPEREAKAMEQRLRRLIFQGMVNMATMGVVDCTNPKFEECAPLYFEYADICSMMRMIDKNQKPQMSQVHINIKKFINALFTAAQEGK